MLEFANIPSGVSRGSPMPLSTVKPEVLAEYKKLLAPLEVTDPRFTFIFSGRDEHKLADRLTLLFESGKVLQERLQERAQCTLSADHLFQISTCLRQARNFFRLARQSDLSVRPIIAFYGMAACAKAVVIGHGSKLQDIPPEHGLRYKHCGADIENDSVKVTRRGLFHAFCHSIENRSGFPFPGEGPEAAWVTVPLKASIDTLKNGVCLKQLLARVAGLEEFFLQTWNLRSAVHRADYWGNYRACSFALRLLNMPSERAMRVRQRVPTLKKWCCTDHWGGDHSEFLNLPTGFRDFEGFDEQKVKSKRTPRAPLAMPLVRRPSGEFVLLEPVHGLHLQQEVIVYCTAFLLSNLARYHPEQWTMIESVGGTEPIARLRAILERFYDLALAWFPLQALACILRSDIAIVDRDRLLMIT